MRVCLPRAIIDEGGAFAGGRRIGTSLMYVPFDAGNNFVVNGPGFVHLQACLPVAVPACLGYRAVFLAMSLPVQEPDRAGGGRALLAGLVPRSRRPSGPRRR